VTNALTIKPTGDPAVLTVAGDISEPATADRIVTEARARFGRADTLVNNAGVFISKPFTDYTAEDYALVVGVNLNGFFWLTQRAVAQMLEHRGGHVVNISATIAEVADSRAGRPDRAYQGRPGRGDQVAGHRVRRPRHPGQRRDPDIDASAG
jgi:NAD(P)-dependent dehydrogenase (short-subunit alcohol dehydrogenase family)